MVRGLSNQNAVTFGKLFQKKGGMGLSQKQALGHHVALLTKSGQI